jgi:hypothetical protein
MTAGEPADKPNLDRQMGQAVVGLALALDQAAAMNTMLTDPDRAFTIIEGGGQITSPKLTALGYTDDEITTIAKAFSALAGLQQVAYGLAAPPSPVMFFADAQALMGVTPL